MEKKLKSLFDFQKFEGNEELAKMIAETESRFNKALSDEDLLMVSAAGMPVKSEDEDEDGKKKK